MNDTLHLALPATPARAKQPPAEPSTLALYQALWRHAAGARHWLILAALMLTASQLLKLAVPWCAAQALDALQHANDAKGLRRCIPWVAAIVGLSIGTWMLHGPGRVIERSVAVRVRRSLSDRLFERLNQAPLAWHESHHSAELAHRQQQAASALSNFTQSQFIYLQNAVNLIGPLVALSLLSSLIGGIGLLGLIAIAATIVAFDHALLQLAHRENAAERRYAAALLDGLTHVTTILSLRLGGATRRLVARRLDAAVEPLKRSIALNEWKWCAVDLLTVSLSWTLVVVYAWRASGANVANVAASAGGGLMLGAVFMVHQYAQQAGGVIGSLAGNLQTFARIRADYSSAAPIWAAPRAAEPATRAPRQDASSETATPDTLGSDYTAAAAPTSPARTTDTLRTRHTDWQRIDLRDLHYQHAPRGAGDSRPPGIAGVSLSLHAGDRIALVGPSGCGKSTLLRLLAGLYTPQRGHAEIDGLTTLALHAVAARTTLIPQEAQVFEASVRENIAFDGDASDARLLQAAHVATFDEVLPGLPHGLASDIAQAGTNLSGGQRQRLCLARGVLAAADSSLLLLDEPTSALDPLSERRVFERLSATFGDACIVAAVHRMSLLAHFDRVVLMVDGAVLDTGTVDELLARQPLFRTMVGTSAERATA